jgi:hypothetical protein
VLGAHRDVLALIAEADAGLAEICARARRDGGGGLAAAAAAGPVAVAKDVVAAVLGHSGNYSGVYGTGTRGVTELSCRHHADPVTYCETRPTPDEKGGPENNDRGVLPPARSVPTGTIVAAPAPYSQSYMLGRAQTMTTIRVADRERFTAVDRRTVNDSNLSFRARGILIWLLDKPNDWRVDSDQIGREGGEGRDAIRTALRELLDAGYIVRHKENGPDGRWSTWTEVHERPVTPGRTEDGKPGAGKPTVGNPEVGEPGPLPKTESEDCDRTLSSPHSPPRGARRKVREPNTPANDPDFLRFWEAFGKFGAQRGARWSWDVAITVDTVDNIVAGATKWREYREATPDGKHKWAQGWLTDERWKDDPPAVVQSSGPMSMMERVRQQRAAERAQTQTGSET